MTFRCCHHKASKHRGQAKESMEDVWRHPDKGYLDQGYPDRRYPDQGYPDRGYTDWGIPKPGVPRAGVPIPMEYSDQGYLES